MKESFFFLFFNFMISMQFVFSALILLNILLPSLIRQGSSQLLLPFGVLDPTWMKKFECPLCDVIFVFCQAALTHECPVICDRTDDGDEAVLERARLDKLERERDKRERAQFAIQMTLRYLFWLTKQVVPFEWHRARGSTLIDCRSMSEFIRSLDAGRPARPLLMIVLSASPLIGHQQRHRLYLRCDERTKAEGEM